MIWFLIKNYFSLSTFMDIEINPFGTIYQWKVDYKISYNELNTKQKKLADEFEKRLRKLDLGY